MKRLGIVGAGGHGKVVADAALVAGWESVVFYDDSRPRTEAHGPWLVVGTIADLLSAPHNLDAAVVAIGNNRVRLEMQRQLHAGGIVIASVVHPAAVISAYANIGVGSVIFAGAVVNAFATLGAACIVNTGATVDHDCTLADGVHLSPGAHLGGTVSVGSASWIGVGAAVRHGVSIGDNVIVGAGAAVVNDIPDNLCVVGVPARPLVRSSTA